MVRDNAAMRQREMSRRRDKRPQRTVGELYPFWPATHTVGPYRDAAPAGHAYPGGPTAAGGLLPRPCAPPRSVPEVIYMRGMLCYNAAVNFWEDVDTCH